MSKKDLINFVKESLTKGFGEEKIRKTLLDTGYTTEEVNGAFQSISEKEQPSEVTTIPKEKILPYQLQEEQIPSTAGHPSVSKKILTPLIILVAFVLIGGASALIYNKFFKKIDPVSLLPQETTFYFKVKINQESQQVKNLKELLNKFPYYEKISQKINEEFEKLKEENPPLKNLDLTISDELIFAWIAPFGEKIEELPIVLILPNPNLSKLKKLSGDMKKSIEESNEWKLETETYKGKIIIKAVSTQEPFARLPKIKLEPSSTLIGRHFILATRPEDIKKIIDVSTGNLKNITSNPAFKKIKEHLPKDYLVLFYGQFDWSKIMKTPGIIGTVTEKEDFLGPLTASLKTALSLPFFKAKEIEKPEKVAFAGVIIAEKNELKSESYSLDLREMAFQPDQFTLKESLAQFVPEKIGNNEVFIYREGGNLKDQFEFAEKESIKSMTPEEKKQFDDMINSLNAFLGVDVKKDILSWMKKNYAILLASEPTGKKTPSVVLILDIEDEQEVKGKLLKIKIPPIPFIPVPNPIPQENITFSKEIIDGFEIYSLPILSLATFDEPGLNFSIKDKKLVFTLTKKGLVNFLKSASDTNQKKLKDSELFAKHFKEIPENIVGISYDYSYGYLGAIKWMVSSILDFYLQGIGTPFGLKAEDFETEKSKAIIFEFLDKGVGPYLKVLKSSGSYSYSLEKGLIVSKGSIIIKELPVEEKRATEKFWDNIEEWTQENLGSVFGPIYVPPIPLY